MCPSSGKELGRMRIDRSTVAALAGVGALLVGGGAALAGNDGKGDRSARCEARLAKIAERRGVSVEQLKAIIEARLLARVEAALAAGTITSEQATKLRQRIADATFCPRAARPAARHAVRHLLAAGADYLGLARAELRNQLRATSLSALAEKQGKSAAGLEAAMLAPAKERLAKAVAAGTLSQARADARLSRLERLVERLVSRTFPA
jgi:hypothetical protein